jgi:hypothetical protein
MRHVSLLRIGLWAVRHISEQSRIEKQEAPAGRRKTLFLSAAVGATSAALFVPTAQAAPLPKDREADNKPTRTDDAPGHISSALQILPEGQTARAIITKLNLRADAVAGRDFLSVKDAGSDAAASAVTAPHYQHPVITQLRLMNSPAEHKANLRNLADLNLGPLVPLQVPAVPDPTPAPAIPSADSTGVTVNAVGDDADFVSVPGMIFPQYVAPEDGDDIDLDVDASTGVIVPPSGGSPAQPGISAISVGGRGLDGPDGSGISADGGGGTPGADGGDVFVRSAATVFTQDDGAVGLFANSRGGNGGNGGDAGGIDAEGGDGGPAGNGGAVTIENLGDVTTLGDEAYGIQAVSQGGVSGTGGDADGLVGEGGGARAGGLGGTAGIINRGRVTTFGEASYGLFSQSIGGRGGTSGDAGGLVSLGSGGGVGGDAGAANVTNAQSGVIETLGAGAHGILAQSIGGGGGATGFGSGVASIGGDSGGGGNSSTVSVSNLGNIIVRGAGASAIVAQSIGGGGGSAGFSTGLAGIGGSAGAGGNGGTVTVSNTSNLFTIGDDGVGILAQSIGGGGGTGGGALGAVSVGGSGGSGGGDAAEVTVFAGGTIFTSGVSATGILAQSIGGGGGNGGSGAGGPIAVGGSGTGGGDAALVTVNLAGSIYTTGDLSDGIVAQSIGGGGGNGGSSDAAGAFGSVAVGGSGGDGGDGFEVLLTSTAGSLIQTEGENAAGAILQSVGGGGGNGGSATSGSIGLFGSASVAVGGSGGAGGDGATVTADLGGRIFTFGDNSSGLIAQSVGGGGGNGGQAIAATAAISPKVSASVAVGVGGDGGVAGDGGDVTITLRDAIATKGANSHGAIVQSIGGGGGNGGWAATASISLAPTASFSAGVSLGGDGGAGGSGGTVTLTSTADIWTQGDSSNGLIAQSIGGGGGNGGFAVSGSISAGGNSVAANLAMGGTGGAGSVGGNVTASSDGLVVTEGDNSMGVVAQSIGGGGGNGGWSATLGINAGTGGQVGVSLGGDGGTGGLGGQVNLVTAGAVHTVGTSAHGVVAQSIGGGGGNGGFAASGGLQAGTGASANVGIGGDGDSGGNGDAVTVTNSAEITTVGSDSIALIAQSIGGGGGNGGWAATLSAAAGGTSLAGAVSLGGSGGSGGDAGTVSVDNTGAFATEGEGSIGLLAQSIGGGGGNGGFAISGALSGGSSTAAVSLSIGGSGGTGGTASAVDVFNQGAISTVGNGAQAVLAQSIGGGGGNGGWAGSLSASGGRASISAAISIGGNGGTGGDSADVTVENSATLTTSGLDSSALSAQSIGGGGGTGGFALSGSLAAGSSGALAASVSVGGQGGTAGNAADVSVISSGALGTSGDRSHGLFAQSVGGGGGTGGWSGNIATAFSNGPAAAVGLSLGGSGGGGGDAGDVTIEQTNIVVTEGAGAHGVFGQSVGGGGGDGGFSLSGTLSGGQKAAGVNVSLGGSGGTAGNAGNVTLTATDTIVTSGAGSFGVLAQSIGGGGGNGGLAGTLAGNLSNQQSVSLGFAIGGDGAGGGDAGDVFVEVSGDVGTQGDAAHGVAAQSIGGGGGNGGGSFSGSLSGARANNLNVAIGGTGGVAGTAGNVDVTSTGIVVTEGDAAYGILAQSIGGGGGQGGFAGALSLSGSNSNAIGLSIGGDAGDGSIGGDVFATLAGVIQTSGEASHAVFAQSVGGGGGQGGMVGVDEAPFGDYLTGTTTGSFGSNSRNLAIAIGGTGGTGNDAGNVDITTSAQILTMERLSHGIYAQSIGGGGGDGGIGRATSGSAGAGRNSNMAVAVGGNGGAGGNGGDVFVDNSGTIQTLAGGSHAVFAQSVGGGGGNGGDAAGFVAAYGSSDDEKQRGNRITVNVGGSGGAAGDGGNVDFTNSGAIIVEGESSHGVFLQSIGGGGGNGGSVADSGDEISDALEDADEAETRELAVAVGGQSGASGNGGDIFAVNSGFIASLDDRGGSGIFAQSIGGGGGNGGNGLAGNVSIGGSGGAAGDGGNIDIENSGGILTNGALAHGIFAQSIGGGGGTGGNTDADDDEEDGEASRDALSAALTARDNYREFRDFYETLEEPEFGLNIGGFGGAAGNGGDIVIVNTGTIRTTGDGAHGIMAQSIGGGGGTGGAGQAGKVGDVSFSGLGGSAGDGGDIFIEHTGDIITEGYGAYGIFAQSIGGGGGVAGDYSFGVGDVEVATQLNPFTGGNGDGGDVTVISEGNIVIRGFGGMGIFAQSVGGGGGLVGLTGDALGLFGSFGGQGSSGIVSVQHSGDVIAPDVNGIAIISQSDATNGQDDMAFTLDSAIRGGSRDGIGVFYDGGRFNVLNTSGSVSAVSGSAIVMTTGDDTINNTGLVVGNVRLGSGANRFDNQVGSSFVAFSTIDLRDPVPAGAASVQAPDETSSDKSLAVQVSEAETPTQAQDVTSTDKSLGVQVSDGVVPASTTMSGALRPGALGDLRDYLSDTAADAFVAPFAGTFTPRSNAGLTDTVLAAAPNSVATFTNAGDFLMGLSASTVPIDLAAGETFGNLDADGDPESNLLYGARVINTVELDGNYTQTEDGRLVFDVAFGPYASDVVNVTGDVVLDGTGDITLTWLSDAESVTLFNAQGDVVDNGLEITDTLAIDFGIERVAGAARLTLESDFGGVNGLNANEAAFGGHMDSVINVGGAEGTGRLLAWLGNLQDEAVYKSIMDELNPEPHVASMQGLLTVSRSFADSAMNCGNTTGVTPEQTCGWVQVTGGSYRRSESFENFGADGDVSSLRAGLEHEVGNGWRLGTAFGYERLNQSVGNNRFGSDGEGFSVGLTARGALNPQFNVSAAVTGGHMSFDSVRRLALLDYTSAEAEYDAGYVDARARIARTSNQENGLFVVPSLELAYTSLDHGGFDETGVGGIGVASEGGTQSVLTTRPAVEAGWVRTDEDGSELRVAFGLEALMLSEDQLTLPISFNSAPAGSTPAIIGTSLDDMTYAVRAGVTFDAPGRTEADIGYRYDFGDTSQNHQFGVRLRMRF